MLTKKEYIAKYYQDGEYYNVQFLDFEEAYTFSTSIEGLVDEAKEVLELSIIGKICDNEPLPKPTVDYKPKEGEAILKFKVDFDIAVKY